MCLAGEREGWLGLGRVEGLGLRFRWREKGMEMLGDWGLGFGV